MNNAIQRVSSTVQSSLRAGSVAKFFATSLVVFAFTGQVFAGPATVQSAYPYADAYFATITVRLAHVTTVAPKMMEMPALPGRDKVAFFEGRQNVEVAVYTQPRPAPLMYVIPGMGGNAMNGSNQFLGERYFLAGFNVIIVPSPFYWKFVLGQSTSGLPGYTPADVADLSRLMQASRARAERDFGIQVTKSGVVGYSLGAIESAYLLKQDRKTKALGLERATMINPPLALAHSIGVLDQLNAVGDQWSPAQRDQLWASVIKGGSALLERGINTHGYFDNLDKVLTLNDDQLKYLIGNTFRQTLTDVVFVSQQINDIGLLKQPATSNRRNARYAEAARFDFTTYLKLAVAPYWQAQLGHGFTTDQLITGGDLAVLRSAVSTDPAYRMVHNADDFLNNPDLIQLWAKEMGSRAVIFPRGGHCGNLWSPDLDATVVNDAKDLLN